MYVNYNSFSVTAAGSSKSFADRQRADKKGPILLGTENEIHFSLDLESISAWW